MFLIVYKMNGDWDRESCKQMSKLKYLNILELAVCIVCSYSSDVVT